MPEMLGVQTWHVPLWRILNRAVDSIGACLSALPGTPVLCRQDETKPEVKSRFFVVFFLKQKIKEQQSTQPGKVNKTKLKLIFIFCLFWQTLSNQQQYLEFMVQNLWGEKKTF